MNVIYLIKKGCKCQNLKKRRNLCFYSNFNVSPWDLKSKKNFRGLYFRSNSLHKIDIYIYLILLQLSHQRPISSHFPALVCCNVDIVNLCQIHTNIVFRENCSFSIIMCRIRCMLKYNQFKIHLATQSLQSHCLLHPIAN